MQVVIVGPDDHDIADAVRTEGHTVSKIGIGNRENLERAGIHAADVYVLTEMDQATSIVVAGDLNEELHTVVYAKGSLPDFASRRTDIAIDPALAEPDIVAEELDRTRSS